MRQPKKYARPPTLNADWDQTRRGNGGLAVPLYLTEIATPQFANEERNNLFCNYIVFRQLDCEEIKRRRYGLIVITYYIGKSVQSCLLQKFVKFVAKKLHSMTITESIMEECAASVVKHSSEEQIKERSRITNAKLVNTCYSSVKYKVFF